ncbi:MAG: hypothetical protein WCT52_00310 [Candidatus Micrarchaeia archaeon]|jgi:hypothetical protein
MAVKFPKFLDGNATRLAYSDPSITRLKAFKIRLLHPFATRNGAMRDFYRWKMFTASEDIKELSAEKAKLQTENSRMLDGFSKILSSSAIRSLRYRKTDPFDNLDSSLRSIRDIATELSGKKNGQIVRE